jgi:uncharacterized membrane protein YgdD (TMEM256/DUF423 family)
MNKWILIVSSLLGASAVMTGAFGAHALQTVLDERAQGWYDTAVTYHAGHALALLGTGLLGLQIGSGAGPGSGKSAVQCAGICLLLGVMIFSGSLYVMAFTGITKLGMLTPIGGIFLILGWLSLAVAASRIRTGVS